MREDAFAIVLMRPPMSPKSRTFLVATAMPRKERQEPRLSPIHASGRALLELRVPGRSSCGTAPIQYE